MNAEWEPGEIALVNGRPCIKTVDGWEHGDSRAFRYRDHEGLEIRPLVVIDPEDIEQIDRLAEGLAGSHRGRLPSVREKSAIASALREFARPTPRIEEPTGLGAVVETKEGRQFLRTSRARFPWVDAAIPGGNSYDWVTHNGLAFCTPISILSPGVTP